MNLKRISTHVIVKLSLQIDENPLLIDWYSSNEIKMITLHDTTGPDFIKSTEIFNLDDSNVTFSQHSQFSFVRLLNPKWTP